MWKMKPRAYFFILIARRPEGNYFFPLWNRGNVACHRSQLTIFQYEKPFAQAANWNLNRNLLGANCQSKYQHCVTILQSGVQTNNQFHCNEQNFNNEYWIFLCICELNVVIMLPLWLTYTLEPIKYTLKIIKLKKTHFCSNTDIKT